MAGETKKFSHNYYGKDAGIKKHYDDARLSLKKVMAADLAVSPPLYESDFDPPPPPDPYNLDGISDVDVDKKLLELTTVSYEQISVDEGPTAGRTISWLDYQLLVINDVFDYIKGGFVPGRVPLASLGLDALYTGATKYRLNLEMRTQIRSWLAQDSPEEDEQDEEEPTGETPVAEKLTKSVTSCADLEQKFLVNNINMISKRHSLTYGRNKRFQTITGHPTDTLNVINGNNISESVFQITPAQQALLVPKLKIFKVVFPDPEKNPKEKYEKELVFNNFLSGRSLERLMNNQAGRGDGVGLKEVSIEFTGNNPYSARRLMRVDMSLFFESFADLFTEERIRQAEAATQSGFDPTAPAFPPDPSFIDLIWRVGATHKNPVTEETQANPDSFQIKLVAGWAVPDDPGGLFPPALMAAIEKNSLVVYLTHTDHDIDFNQDGSIELKIRYHGRSEELLDSPTADIFQSIKSKHDIKNLREETARIWKLRSKKGISPQQSEEIRKEVVDLKKKEKNLRANTKKERLRAIIDDLVDTDSIKVMDPPWESFKQLKKLKNFTAAQFEQNASEEIAKQIKGVFDTDPEKVDSATKNISALNDTLFNSAQRPKEGTYRLHYFYLGDLINSLIKIVKWDNPSMDDIQFLMTTFEHAPPGHGAPKLIPIESIPISLAYFNDWLTTNVVGSSRQGYFLLNFFKDFFQNVIVKSLNFTDLDSPHHRRVNYRTQIGFKVFSLPKVGNQDPLRSGFKNRPGASPMFDFVDHFDISELEEVMWKHARQNQGAVGASVDYVVFYPHTSGVGKKSGDYNEDIRRGIYHLFIGKDSGIVKNISFQKTSTPKLAEANFAAQEKSIAQLFRTYDASVQMYGNTIFFPGSTLYINPSFLGNVSGPSSPNSVFRRFGLGGYYRVNKVNMRISANEFSTELTCKWISSGDMAGPQPIGDNNAKAGRR